MKIKNVITKLFFNVFNYNKIKLLNLVKTDRYKKSNYVIQKHNNSYYVLKRKDDDSYVDLINKDYKWKLNDKYFKSCKGNISNIIYTFNYLVPVIEEIKSIEEY